MNFSNFLNKEPEKVNCQEAYSIWDILSAKYQFLEKLNIWQNFAHDKKLKSSIDNLEDILLNMIHTLELQAEKHSIPGPEVGVEKINTSSNTEVIRDEMIAQDIFLWQQEITQGVLRAIKTATTNDELRKTFIKINKTNLEKMNNFIPYLRDNGWVNVPLKYQFIPENINEDIDTGEVYHLWDHLTFRYDNIRQTDRYKDLVNDNELKILINIGLNNVLKKQAIDLEKTLNKFGIPLPKKPVKVIAWPSQATNFIKDDFMYRTIYMGLIGATSYHNVAVKQCLTNDNIRKLFIELLISEIDILDKFTKYGKIKGYLNEPPQFNINKTLSLK